MIAALLAFLGFYSGPTKAELAAFHAQQVAFQEWILSRPGVEIYQGESGIRFSVPTEELFPGIGDGGCSGDILLETGAAHEDGGCSGDILLETGAAHEDGEESDE